MKTKRCRDCIAEGITTNRKIVPNSGGRCATHHRLRKRELSKKRHEVHIASTYGITSGEYEELYEAQGGKCYICRRATGATRRLAVDHDHATGYVRGLLCKTCNRQILGHLRDDPAAFQRAIDYLNSPPAFGVIGKRRVPKDGAPVKGGLD